MTASLQSRAWEARSAAELVAEFERAVADLDLTAGERVPSVRSLARATGLAPGTVSAAIGELRRRRTIVTRDRSGSVIADRRVDGGAAAGGTAYVPAGAVDLASGWPDPGLLPPLRPVLAGLAEAGWPTSGYDPSALDPRLESWWREHVPVPGAAVTVTSGALDAVDRALGASQRHGDGVVVEDPGYPPLLQVLRAQGLVPRPVRVDDEGLDPEGLRRALSDGVSAVVCTPQGQNPTGARLTPRRAEALRSVLRGQEVLVIEDDHLGLLVADPPSLAGATARWLVARSVSKALGPDLRVALVAGDAETVAGVAARVRTGPGWVSHLLQRAVAALVTDTATSGELMQAVSAYDERRAALLADLAARGVAAVGASGLNVWVPVADETATCLALAEAGYAVAPGTPYRLASPPAVRITTARLDPSDAPAVADAVAKARFR